MMKLSCFAFVALVFTNVRGKDNIAYVIIDQFVVANLFHSYHSVSSLAFLLHIRCVSGTAGSAQ